DLQDKVASSVAGVIEPALQAAETARSAAHGTADLTAYDLYLRAYAMVLSSAKQIPERWVLWSRRSRAIRVMGRPSPGPRSVVIGCLLTAEARIGRRTL